LSPTRSAGSSCRCSTSASQRSQATPRSATRNGLGRWQHIEYAVGFKHTAIDSVGGIPTDTLAEDTGLTIALGVAGWRIAYEGQARAWTEGPATLRQLWSQRYRWGYGMMQACWKHRHAIGRGPVTGPGAPARTWAGSAFRT
jgi:hypothetical protein